MLVLKWLGSDSGSHTICSAVTNIYCFHSKITECRYWNKVSFSFSEGKLVYSFVDQVFYHMFFTKCQINTATRPLVSNFVTTRRTFKHEWEIVFNYAMKLLITREKFDMAFVASAASNLKVWSPYLVSVNCDFFMM